MKKNALEQLIVFLVFSQHLERSACVCSRKLCTSGLHKNVNILTHNFDSILTHIWLKCLQVDETQNIRFIGQIFPFMSQMATNIRPKWSNVATRCDTRGECLEYLPWVTPTFHLQKRQPVYFQKWGSVTKPIFLNWLKAVNSNQFMFSDAIIISLQEIQITQFFPQFFGVFFVTGFAKFFRRCIISLSEMRQGDFIWGKSPTGVYCLGGF